MAVKLTTTKDQTNYIKCLIYGPSGIGKTTLAKTCPKPVIISSEKKMVALKDENIPVVIIENHMDLEAVLKMIATDTKFKSFETVILDSISDIAETVLDYFKKNPVDGNTHPQAAYGQLADTLTPLIKKFRDIPGKHVYVIAKAKYMKDEHTGITSWHPSMPGQQLGPGLPYMFDFVFAMRNGETEKGKKYRYLQTEECLQWLAKGIAELNPIEKPHLGELFQKVLGKSDVSSEPDEKESEEG